LSRLFKAHLAILTANVIFGLNFVIAKGIMPVYLLPLAIIFVRVLGTASLFWILHFFAPKEKVTPRDLIILAVCAFFGVALNQILFFEGLNLTSPIDASIIITIIPITVLIFAHFLIKEKITANRLIGILLGAAGAVMVIMSAGRISFQSSTFLGNLMVFINACSYGFYLVLVKPLMERYNTFTIMKWLFLFGFIFIGPFCFNTFTGADYSSIPLKIWGSILFVIFATTALAYWLNNYSLKTVSPTVNGIYIYLQPLIASGVSVMLGKDHIEAIEVLASAMIIMGVYLVSRKSSLTRQLKTE
jgi:drug/metabolite transporter (DMT)-like permease